MTISKIKSPYPMFGGKGRVAKIIWSGLGEVSNYVEPFAGSLAVLLANPKVPKIETVNDKDCVSPETLILNDKLKWVRADSLKIGDQILGFDEFNGLPTGPGLKAPSKYRRFNHATILEKKELYKPSYKLIFNDGTSVISSENHMWLVGSHKTGKGGRGWRWVKTANLVANRKNQKSWILKIVDVVERDLSYDAGWLAGILDGEGHIVVGSGVKIIISQNDGPILNRIEHVLSKYNINFFKLEKRKCKQIIIKGGVSTSLQFLMKIGSIRLINNLIKNISKISLYGRKHKAISLESKEFLGEQKVIALQTSSNTFIANGLASHNCFIANFWRAVANAPDEVIKFADTPVHEADLHARHKWILESADEAFVEKMHSDPDHFNAKMAGWWVWGMGASVGNNWLQPKGLKAAPLLSSAGGGIHGLSLSVKDWISKLHTRTRRIRMCCGDWSKLVTPAVTFGNKGLTSKEMTAVFLDPPYDYKGRDKVYREETNVWHAAYEWAIKNGDNPKLRIVLCGYEGDYEIPDNWQTYSWQTNGGFANLGNDRGKDNSKKERIYFSPHCLKISD